MRKYHSAMKAPVDELHINMPISLRKKGVDAQNAVTIARFDLPMNITNIGSLMNSLDATVKRLRAEPALDYTNQLGEISRFIPTELLTSAAQASDVTASNVPGPPIPVYLAGAKVEAMVPLPPPIGAAVFVALLTYNGTASIGVAMDDAAIADRELLMKSLGEGFAEVTGKPVNVGDPFVAASAKSGARKKPTPTRQPAQKATNTRTRKVSAKAAPAKKRTPRKKAAVTQPARKQTTKRSTAKR
jgi:hypothetical protein